MPLCYNPQRFLNTMYSLKDLIHNVRIKKTVFVSPMPGGRASEQAKAHWGGNLTRNDPDVFKHLLFRHRSVHAIGTEVAHLHLTPAFSVPCYLFSQIRYCSSRQPFFRKSSVGTECLECLECAECAAHNILQIK